MKVRKEHPSNPDHFVDDQENPRRKDRCQFGSPDRGQLSCSKALDTNITGTEKTEILQRTGRPRLNRCLLHKTISTHI